MHDLNILHHRLTCFAMCLYHQNYVEVAHDFDLYANRAVPQAQRTVVDYTPDVWDDALFHGHIIVPTTLCS